MKRTWLPHVALVLGACSRSGEDVAIGGPYDSLSPPVDASATAPCVGGRKRCDANTPVLCTDAGTWLTQGPCSGNEPACEEGVCRSVPTSCDGTPPNCGANGDSSCCASALVPGGTFLRNYDGVTNADAGYPATVSDFRLDLFEITVGRFRKFFAAYPGSLPASGAGKNPANATDPGWDPAWNSAMPRDQTALRTDLLCDANRRPVATWTDAIADNEARPIVCASWAVLMAFCIWDGGRLPTEAEWNYAASGGAEQRVFAWSVPPTSSAIDLAHASYGCLGDENPACTTVDLVRVGTRPAGNGRWGHADMVGNAAEYVVDHWSEPPPKPCDNCAARSDTTYRTLRTSSFDGPTSDQGIGRRGYGYLHYAYPFGARCARPL